MNIEPTQQHHHFIRTFNKGDYTMYQCYVPNTHHTLELGPNRPPESQSPNHPSTTARLDLPNSRGPIERSDSPPGLLFGEAFVGTNVGQNMHTILTRRQRRRRGVFGAEALSGPGESRMSVPSSETWPFSMDLFVRDENGWGTAKALLSFGYARKALKYLP